MGVVRARASGDPFVDGLIWGSKWTGTVTYEVERSAAGSNVASVSPPPELTPALHRVMNEIADFSRLELVPVRGGTDAVVRVFAADVLPTGSGAITRGGYAYLPTEAPVGGDVYLALGGTTDFRPGSVNYHILAHEVGHALGLKHPHEAENGFERMPSSRDGLEWTVMTYRAYPGAPFGINAASDGFSSTYAPYDIAALQELYGANYTDRGNDRYVFDPTERVMMQTVWDGGGTDTYDFSRYTRALEIDLNPGGWSTTGQEPLLNRSEVFAGNAPVFAQGAVHNAFLHNGSWLSAIEHALGGSGDDRLSGSKLANLLRGNAGDDTVLGGVGNDTLMGGPGADNLHGSHGVDTLVGEGGDDTLRAGDDSDRLFGGPGDDDLFGGRGADYLNSSVGDDRMYAGHGADTLLGSNGRDVLAGGTGPDHLEAGNGNDTLLGGNGNDTLLGGRDNDVYVGGGGYDHFVFPTRPGADRVADFRPGVDVLDVPNPTAAFASAREVSGSAVLDVGAGTVKLIGIALSRIDIDDFI